MVHKAIADVTDALRNTAQEIVDAADGTEEKARLAAKFRELMDMKASLRRKMAQRIYFLHAPSARAIKIGISIDIDKRIQSLRSGSPVSLTLLGTIAGGADEEKEIHNRWAHIRMHGEWFSATSELLDDIDRMIDKPVMDARYGDHDASPFLDRRGTQ